ncbi:ankyrin repeat-containing protein [Heterostelium album PN500]|uniref:Ankyrin repeat-containing protein n=1 Tax=Heterostelium pallidum (strain ATCC 26659 / Pp 5 / PN500) TaxID=670386 RepID=D3BQS0_HETP5|nr:ankyrin repeat-containing protein [Heterostelium album PN500]EFA76490.1 ankyrin repeat-containing protein [Heterostelium album PN500]|eukprot:XP_020428622.1 ankyrin repeat-containing protein [Heterostelium album PN500]
MSETKPSTTSVSSSSSSNNNNKDDQQQQQQQQPQVKDVTTTSSNSPSNSTYSTASSVVLNPPTVTITSAAANQNQPSPTQSRNATTSSASSTSTSSNTGVSATTTTTTSISSSTEKPPVLIATAATTTTVANTSTSSLSSSSASSSPNTSHQNLQPLSNAATSTSTTSNLNPSTLSTTISLAASQNSANSYHAEEVQFAFENKKTLKRLLKISKHWTDSMKVYCQNSHLFSEEMLKQSEQMIAFAQPKEKTLGGNLAYFGNTLKAVNSVHDQMLNEIQDVFCTPVANFVDYDFAEVAESHKRVTKSKEEYEQSLGKISTSIKKKGIDETRLFNYEQELEKLKEVLENQNKDLEIKLGELSHKNETKYLRSVLHFINSQYLFFNRGAKLLGNLKPRIEELERYLEEIQPPKVVEGHLMKKSKQVMGGWNKCWYVLKDGMLYCYKGKKEFHPENALNILLCSVRVPQQPLISSPSSTNPPASGSSKEQSKEQVDYRFEILHPRKKQPIVLQAENEEERDRWVAAIQEAISNSLNSQSIEKSSLSNSTVGKPLSSSTVGGSGASGDEVNQQVMRIIQKAAGNNICADCSSQDPDWASINLGVIICKVCSGVHRSLGTHISKVRSLTLDKWIPENIYLMKEIGNAKFNLLYEHQLSDQVKPTEKSDRPTKETYIRAKYKTKDFIIKSTLPTEELSKMLYEMASATGPRDIARYLKLIGQGAEVNHVDASGRTTLHQVIWKSDDVIIPELLLQNGADLSMVDSRGWTPMHYAAYFNRPRCASLLMKRGFEAIRLKCMDHLGRLPIDLAVSNRSKETEQVLRGEDINLGLTMDTIEAGSVQPFEASVPLSTDFPNATSLATTREEILSEDDDDKYAVAENEMESSWSESERESIGRASFSGADGSDALAASHHPNIQLNASLNSNISTNSGGNSSNQLIGAEKQLSTNNNSSSNISKDNLNGSNTSATSGKSETESTKPPINSSINNTSTGNLAASVNSSNTNETVPINHKLNRPKSKRRPSLLGRGKNTLRLMKSKLSISGKGIPNDAGGNAQGYPGDENGFDDDSDEDDATVPTVAITSTSNGNGNNPEISVTATTTTTTTGTLDPTLPNLVHRESMDNVHNNKNNNSLQPQQVTHTNSYNDLISAEDEKDKSSPSRQNHSPTPFKLLLNKFKGMTKKKDSGKEGTHSDSNDDDVSDVPDNVSVTTNDDTKSDLSDFVRKKKKKEKQQSKASTTVNPTTTTPTSPNNNNNNNNNELTSSPSTHNNLSTLPETTTATSSTNNT